MEIRGPQEQADVVGVKAEPDIVVSHRALEIAHADFELRGSAFRGNDAGHGGRRGICGRFGFEI